jgi:hypothetical protein
VAKTAVADNGIVVTSNFVRAARDAGYGSLSTALAELVDNSLQASATLIEITLTRSAQQAAPSITVLDNGRGMNRAELFACLKFGGSSRFNDRQSLGRYGMGLPGASLSQARRVRVEAWQNGSAGSFVALDVDAAAAGDVSRLIPRRAPSTLRHASDSGCQVTWEDCDRIEYQRLGWLERALAKDLGRMFRYFLQSDARILLNGRAIRAHDPLFLTEQVDGVQATAPFEALSYKLPTDDGEGSTVSVRFAELPVQQWHGLDAVTKRRLGIVGGAGVSVIRAGREIAFGWHLVGGKRRENYDDWWRCEVRFEPPLDEAFGITNNKQGIRPTATLRQILEPEIESMARLLNARVRQAFESVKFEAAAGRSCQIAGASDHHLPAIRPSGTRSTRAARPLTYRLSTEARGAAKFLSARVSHNTLEVTVNSDHAGYAALYKPLQELDSKDGSDLRAAIELLLLSLARSGATLDAARDSRWDELATLWSNSFATMLRNL